MKVDFEKCAELLKAIAHPTRLKILDELKGGKKCVTDIKELIDVSQPNLSQHLKILRQAEVIAYKEEGNRRCYYLVKKNISSALTLLMACDYVLQINKKEES